MHIKLNTPYIPSLLQKSTQVKNSQFTEQNDIITFCISPFLLCFVLPSPYSTAAELFQFLGPVLRQNTSVFQRHK